MIESKLQGIQEEIEAVFLDKSNYLDDGSFQERYGTLFKGKNISNPSDNQFFKEDINSYFEILKKRMVPSLQFLQFFYPCISEIKSEIKETKEDFWTIEEKINNFNKGNKSLLTNNETFGFYSLIKKKDFLEKFYKQYEDCIQKELKEIDDNYSKNRQNKNLSLFFIFSCCPSYSLYGEENKRMHYFFGKYLPSLTSFNTLYPLRNFWTLLNSINNIYLKIFYLYYFSIIFFEGYKKFMEIDFLKNKLNNDLIKDGPKRSEEVVSQINIDGFIFQKLLKKYQEEIKEVNDYNFFFFIFSSLDLKPELLKSKEKESNLEIKKFLITMFEKLPTYTSVMMDFTQRIEKDYSKDLSNTIINLEKENERLKIELQRINKELEDKKIENERLKIELQRKNEELEDFKKKEISKYDFNLKEKEQQIELLLQENLKLKELEEKKNKEIDLAVEKLSQLENNFKKDTNKKNENSNEKSNLNSEIMVENKNLKEQIRKFEKELENLRAPKKTENNPEVNEAQRVNEIKSLRAELDKKNKILNEYEQKLFRYKFFFYFIIVFFILLIYFLKFNHSTFENIFSKFKNICKNLYIFFSNFLKKFIFNRFNF